jgi:hypothetical protein
VANANRIAFCIETSHWVLVSDDTLKLREASGCGCRLLACTLGGRLLRRSFQPALRPTAGRFLAAAARAPAMRGITATAAATPAGAAEGRQRRNRQRRQAGFQPREAPSEQRWESRQWRQQHRPLRTGRAGNRGGNGNGNDGGRPGGHGGHRATAWRTLAGAAAQATALAGIPATAAATPGLRTWPKR